MKRTKCSLTDQQIDEMLARADKDKDRYRPCLEKGSDQLIVYRGMHRQCIYCQNQLIRTFFEGQSVDTKAGTNSPAPLAFVVYTILNVKSL